MTDSIHWVVINTNGNYITCLRCYAKKPFYTMNRPADVVANEALAWVEAHRGCV
jgi:hypothetical protein